MREVAADWFADFALVALEIQNVVHYLKRHAQLAGVFAQGGDLGIRRAAQRRARLARRPEQRRRLVVDAEVVVLKRLIRVVGAHPLAQLAARQLHDGLREAAYDADVFGVADERGGRREHVIAHKDGEVVAVHARYGRAPAADVGGVHRVVVDEGGYV